LASKYTAKRARARAHTDRHTQTDTHTETDTQTETHTDRHTHADRHTHRQTRSATYIGTAQTTNTNPIHS